MAIDHGSASSTPRFAALRVHMNALLPLTRLFLARPICRWATAPGSSFVRGVSGG
jgi:hypothetical protein